MGCRSDYLEPTNQEVEASKVLALLEEVKTGVLPDYFGNGAYSKVYNGQAKEILKKKVPSLCKKLSKKSESEIKNFSLELQLWWRDHLKADKERLETSLKEVKEKREREALIAKMTPHERNLLGL
jgi:hypothetical protein